MKRKSLLSLAIICVVLLSFLCSSSYAVEEASVEKNNLISTLDEKLDQIPDSNLEEDAVANTEVIGDQYLAGKIVTVPEGIYDGNIYIMGENVIFSGASVKGNVYVMAKNLKLNATSISGSLYAMAGTLEASNETSVVDAYIMAQVIKTDSTFTNDRSFKAMGTYVELNGSYIYDVDLFVGDSDIDIVSINSENFVDKITNSSKVEANLVLGNNLVIGRNFNYSANSEVEVPSTASINAINFSKVDKTEIVDIETEKDKLLSMATLLKVVIRLINAAFITIALGWTCKRYRRLNQYHSGIGLFFKSILKGSIGAILFITIALSLVITIAFAGIGLVGTGYFLYGVFFSLAFAANMTAINILGIREESSEGMGYKVAMLGVTLIVALVIWGISLIPVVGGIATLIIAMMGLGGVMDLVFGNSKRLEEKYQRKMSKKYKDAKVNPSNEVQTEEPKLDESNAFDNTSVMMDSNEVDNQTDENIENTEVKKETPIDTEPKTSDSNNVEKNEIDDSKKDE